MWRALVPFGPADLDAGVQRRGDGWEAMVVCGDSNGGGGYPMWQGGASTPYPDAEAAKRAVEARLAEWARDLAAAMLPITVEWQGVVRVLDKVWIKGCASRGPVRVPMCLRQSKDDWTWFADVGGEFILGPDGDTARYATLAEAIYAAEARARSRMNGDGGNDGR